MEWVAAFVAVVGAAWGVLKLLPKAHERWKSTLSPRAYVIPFHSDDDWWPDSREQAAEKKRIEEGLKQQDRFTNRLRRFFFNPW